MFDFNLEIYELAEMTAWIISYISKVCDPVGFEGDRGPDVVVLLKGKRGETQIKVLSQKKSKEISRGTIIKGLKLRNALLPRITTDKDFVHPPSDFFL